MKNIKPLGRKAYGSIPHLPGSRLGPAERCINHGQVKILTEKTRDKHDLIIVQEKLDGSNCSVAKIQGGIFPLTRAGYIANTSPFEQHHVFYNWVDKRAALFDALLDEGERIVGEWLYQAHGTRYELVHAPFVPFDLITGTERLNYNEFFERVKEFCIPTPRTIHVGQSYPLEKALRQIKTSGHGAIDPVEGVIYRCERKGKVDFLAKYVRHDKQDGIYLPEVSGKEPVYNCKL